jgi:hypothetical protein
VTNLNSIFTFIGSAATVALIVTTTRWVSGATGALLPTARDGKNLYGIKWQWAAVSYSGVVFWIAMIIWSWRNLYSPDWTVVTVLVVFVFMGIWLASGVVTTDLHGITKRSLLRSRSIRWEDITEIRLHKKDGGAIDLRAGRQRIVIDVRFAARQHLLTEIIARTRLQPIGKLP